MKVPDSMLPTHGSTRQLQKLTPYADPVKSSSAMFQVVEATLEGATPLHFAAIRGNPAQADHLIYCNGDPTVKTAAGLLPLELVPLCGDHDAEGGRICRCMHPADADIWECRSRVTREMLMQRMLTCFSIGIRPWMRLSLQVRQRTVACSSQRFGRQARVHTARMRQPHVTCAMLQLCCAFDAPSCKDSAQQSETAVCCVQVCRCWLGLWGMSKTLARPQVAAFVADRHDQSSLQERSDALSWVGAACQQAEQGGNALVRAYQLVETLLRNHVVSSAIPPDAAAQLGLGGYTGTGQQSAHDSQPTEVVLSASVTDNLDGTATLMPAGVEVPLAPGLVTTHPPRAVAEVHPDGAPGGHDSILLKAHRHDHGNGLLGGGECRSGGSRPMLTLSQTDEAAALYLEAFEHASKAAVLYAQACDTILQLTRRGFLMRPAQLEQAEFDFDDASRSCTSHTLPMAGSDAGRTADVPAEQDPAAAAPPVAPSPGAVHDQQQRAMPKFCPQLFCQLLCVRRCCAAQGCVPACCMLHVTLQQSSDQAS